MGQSGKKARSQHGEKLGDRHDMESLVDKLAEFDEFEKEILPALREDIKSGMTAEKIRQKYLGMVTGMMVTTALVDRDPKTRLAAARDLTDRVEGKATERSEQTHKFEGMDEEQVAAVLKTKLNELEDDEPESDGPQEHRH